MAAKSLPAALSDMAVQPIRSPLSKPASHVSRAASEPLTAMRNAALWWLMNAKASEKSTFASAMAARMRAPKPNPRPPRAAGTSMPASPCLHASRTRSPIQICACAELAICVLRVAANAATRASNSLSTGPGDRLNSSIALMAQPAPEIL
jgi:hypothetical protein